MLSLRFLNEVHVHQENSYFFSRVYCTVSTVLMACMHSHLVLMNICGRSMVYLIRKMSKLRHREVSNLPSLPKVTVSRW